MVKESTVYLDHAAATPMDTRVVEVMTPYFSDAFYNPSSPYAPAVFVKRAYREAKANIAKHLGVGVDELVMTAGATESINLAFLAANGGDCLVSAIEHSSVLGAAQQYGTRHIIPVSKKRRVDPNAVRERLTDDTRLVSVALVNHELGYVQPIDEIAKIIQDERIRRKMAGNLTPIYFHTDAAQAATLLDVKVKRLGVDLLTLSAAKAYGPKQVGLLWVRPGVKLQPLMIGGGQEAGLRGGTENVAGVVGFAKALELAAARRKAEVARLRGLRQLMIKELSELGERVVFLHDDKKSLVNYISVSFPGVDAERLVFRLEAEGVFVGTGSACAANSGARSTVLSAIGCSNEEIDGSLRITLGRLNNEENVQYGARKIVAVVREELAR